MAREFGAYSPAVPLGVTWEESIGLDDEDGNPIDITGYSAYAQMRSEVPVLDPATGNPTTTPVLELTTVHLHATPPDWPVVEALTIPNPTDGTILLRVDVDDLWTASPDNSKAKLVWSIVLVNTSTDYAIPVVQGKVTFLPARSVRS